MTYAQVQQQRHNAIMVRINKAIERNKRLAKQSEELLKASNK